MSSNLTTAQTQTIDQAITSRRSVRAFLPTAVDQSTIRDILTVAARAPSGTNTQPWRVYVVTGEKKQSISDLILATYNNADEDAMHQEQYHYYPVEWKSPYIDRRRKIGWDLYSLLGLTRDNKAGMHTQHGKNYQFFGAPVGLFFTIDRVMEKGSWLDYGMFLQNIMIAARARNLHTCAQGAFTKYHKIIAEILGFSEDEMLVCGMSLGYEDTSKIENTLITERASVDEFAVFVQ